MSIVLELEGEDAAGSTLGVGVHARFDNFREQIFLAFL